MTKNIYEDLHPWFDGKPKELLPGMIIEVTFDDILDYYLVGDVNLAWGTCGACCDLEMDLLSEKTKVRWTVLSEFRNFKEYKKLMEQK